MSWTDEKVEKLRDLWKKGHTASQIAEVLGDTTRNAVIGKAHRLNLEARAPSKYSGGQTSRESKPSMVRVDGLIRWRQVGGENMKIV